MVRAALAKENESNTEFAISKSTVGIIMNFIANISENAMGLVGDVN